MAKIYNEIVVDMNPESPTFEETLYEDSFEYSGDMMLAQGDISEGHQIAVGENVTGWKVYEWTNGAWKYTGANTQQETMLGEDIMRYKSITEANQKLSGEYSKPVGERPDVGLPSMTEEIWSGMDIEEQANYILDVKYQGNIPNEENDLEYLVQLLDKQPVKAEADPTEVGFLKEQYGGYDKRPDIQQDFGPGADGIYGTEDDPGGIAGRSAGITYGTAGRTKDTMLTGLQQAAFDVGGAGQSVYGGGGAGARADVTGTAALSKKFETGMETYEAAGDVYDVAGTQAGLDYRKGIYGLETTAEAGWASDWTTFLGSLPSATV